MWATTEQTRRTPGWTPGQAIHLADDSGWFLPRFDLALLATHHGLAAELKRILRLEAELTRLGIDSLVRPRWAATRVDLYRGLITGLLRLNYNLSAEEWDEVFPADRGEWFSTLVRVVGDAIVLALIDDWRSLAFSFLGVAAEPDPVLAN